MVNYLASISPEVPASRNVLISSPPHFPLSEDVEGKRPHQSKWVIPKKESVPIFNGLAT